MKLYAYELKLYKEEPTIEIKAFGARENKTEYFSSTHDLPIDAYQSKGGWYINKSDIGKNAYLGVGNGMIYVIFLTNTKIDSARSILQKKLMEIVEADRLRLSIKEKLLENLKSL
jgi:hypothetical protein